jgi:hypothetical protein
MTSNDSTNSSQTAALQSSIQNLNPTLSEKTQQERLQINFLESPVAALTPIPLTALSDEELREWVIQLRSLHTTTQTLKASVEKEAISESIQSETVKFLKNIKKSPSIDDLMNLECKGSEPSRKNETS